MVLVLLLCAGAVHLPAAGRTAAQQDAPAADASDADLERASGLHTVSLRLGTRITSMPLEVYVARVIAGEGEPGAPDATQQALAVAIRTFAIVNAKRHAREGFSLCDTTHCQVPRVSTAASRQAALATAGRILTFNGTPAEVFYSASCGGRSERASDVWPNANFPYLQSVVDDVHEDEPAWTLALTLREIQTALAATGATGRLTGIDVDGHTESGRVARLSLPGLTPASMSGDAFRAAVGARALRSTAFTLVRDGDAVRFTGRGYGHGIGMCVIGAGRRARRGESVEQILAAYYPGLALVSVDGAGERLLPSSASGPGGQTPVERLEDLEPVIPPPDDPGRAPVRETTDAPAVAPPAVPTPAAKPPTPTVSGARPVPPRSIAIGIVDGSTLQERGRLARDHVAAALGVAPPDVTVELTPTLEEYRRETGLPWWVTAAPRGRTIVVAPTALTDPERLDDMLRVAMARQVLTPVFADRPAWVLHGAAQYYAREARQRPAPPRGRLSCPADAELVTAVSAVAQRTATDRAELCFARGLAQAGDWRQVR